LNEFIFKASDNGQLYIDAATKQQGNFGLEITQRSALVQQKNEDYTTVVSNLTRLQEPGPMETMATFAALATDQIRDAITAEAVSAALLSLLTM
jgi:hypothetical protein